MTSSSYVLVIPFEMKDTAKENKCRWNKEDKYWYINTEEHIDNDELPVIMKFIDDYSRVNLPLTTYNDREELKANGAKWDVDEKKWYTYKCNDNLQKFMCTTNQKKYCKIAAAAKKKVKKQEHDKIKQEFLANGGTEESFGPWYSVNILGHE